MNLQQLTDAVTDLQAASTKAHEDAVSFLLTQIEPLATKITDLQTRVASLESKLAAVIGVPPKP